MNAIVARCMAEQDVLRIERYLIIVDIVLCQLCLVMPYAVISFKYRLPTILADNLAVIVRALDP